MRKMKSTDVRKKGTNYSPVEQQQQQKKKKHNHIPDALLPSEEPDALSPQGSRAVLLSLTVSIWTDWDVYAFMSIFKVIL